MSFPEPFPEDILDEIREYPGNDKCCDCPSIDTDWASVSHGTLICLECAGKHRSLGVHVSFVRSITMDTWSRQQVEMMRQGGNGQIRRFFKKLEIDNSPIHILYCTKGAEHYRDKLKERVEKIMNGEIKSEKRIVNRKLLVEETKPIVASSSIETPTFDVTFGDGPLGLTLTKDFKERASVSRLVPAGAAQLAGVLVGDFVVGVAGKKLSNYDEIMHMIPCMGRPLTLKFGRIPAPKSGKTSHPTPTPSSIANVHPSKSEPNLALAASRSPEMVQHQQPTSTVVATSSAFKTSTSSEALEGKESKTKEPSTPKIIPRVAVRGAKKSSSDISVDFDEQQGRATTPAKSLRRATAKGSNDSLTKLEQRVDESSPSKESRTTETENINHYSSLGVRLTQSEKVVKSSWKGSEDATDEPHHSSNDSNGDDDDDDDGEEEEEEESEEEDDEDEEDEDDDEDEEDDGDEDDDEDEEEDELDAEDNENQHPDGEEIRKYVKEEIEKVEAEAHAAEEAEQEIVNAIEDGNDYGNFVQEECDNLHNRKEEEEQPTVSAFAPGSVVKVLRESDNRWKNAVIHRVHKDGSFKVIYSNGTKESHVDISRLASNAVVLGPAPASTVSHLLNQTQQTTKYQEALSSITFGHYETGADDGKDFEFKVDTTEDLDAWIEKDLASELKSIEVQYEDSYFLKKTVQAPPLRNQSSTSFAKTEIETATYKEFTVTFEQAPLGLTLSANKNKEPSVIRIKSEGNAQMAGVAIGDVLLQIDQYPVSEYDEAMRILPGCIYPLTLRFRRGARNLVLESGEAFMKGSIFVASKLMDTMGLNNKTSILDQPTPVRVSGASKQAVVTTPVVPPTAKPRYLPASPSEGEFDIVFEQGELGFRLDEKPGITVVSVVTEVSDKGQAQQKGLKMGCVLVGINRDPYLSHAHAVSTLKHAKRPVSVRFKHRNYS